MFAKAQTVVQIMEQLAPKKLAMPDDRIGLQLGTLQKEAAKVMIALDVVDSVVEEAIQEQVDLIIAHHAIIYHPIKHIQTSTPIGKLYEKLIKRDIAVYVAHTNYDIAPGGMNDLMAAAIGLKEANVLLELDSLAPILDASKASGRPQAGLGRIGVLGKAVPLEEFAHDVKKALNVPFVRVVGDLSRPIMKAAVIGGSGGRYVHAALFAGADVLITGDIDYHTAQDALAAGLAIIDPGHNAEKIMKRAAAQYLQTNLNEKKYDTEVIFSKISTEPFQLLS